MSESGGTGRGGGSGAGRPNRGLRSWTGSLPAEILDAAKAAAEVDGCAQADHVRAMLVLGCAAWLAQRGGDGFVPVRETNHS